MSIAECASDEPYATQIGPFGKALTPQEYTESGVPLLRGVNVNHGRFHDDDFVYVSEETAERMAKYESFPGDVLLVHKGTLGKIGLMPTVRRYKRYIMGNSMLRVRCNPAKLLPEYLYYWLGSSEGTDYIMSRVSQVGVPQIQQPLTTLRSCRLPIPPIRQQQAIADCLGALDDKIELNRRMNETLEAMARALFRSWFVDFDPVRAKSEGRPTGLPADLDTLFPSEFEDSALGEIPKGWRAGSFGDEFHLLMGQSPPGDTYNAIGDGLPFFQGKTDFGFRFPSNRIYCSAPTRIAEPGQILISVRAPVGDVNVAIEKSAIGRGVAAALHRSQSASYTLHTLTELRSQFNVFDGEGTVFGSINKADFQKLSVMVPSGEIVSCFEAMCQPLDAAVLCNERENRSLAKTRDELLPRLLSGEIEVAEGGVALYG